MPHCSHNVLNSTWQYKTLKASIVQSAPYSKFMFILLFLGTGSNACFVEYVKNFNNLNPDEVDSDQV